MKKSSSNFLIICNWLLLSASWAAAIYSYPRLPGKFPLWLNLGGQESVPVEKSLLFFVYPLTQTIFFLLFLGLSRFIPFGKMMSWNPDKMTSRRGVELLGELKREFIHLVLIFINLIFIHIQTSLIFSAYQEEKGFNKFYFTSLFVIILILIPYYRLRTRMLMKKLR